MLTARLFGILLPVLFLSAPLNAQSREEFLSSKAGQFYLQAGLLVGEGEIPFVGDLSFVRGPDGESTGILGLSLANDNLQFEREEPGFAARYRVSVEMVPSGPGTTISRNWEERVKVKTFFETNLPTETVIFQAPLPELHPGTYRLTLRVEDLNNLGKPGVVSRTVEVPSFTHAGIALTPPEFLHYSLATAEVRGEEGEIDFVLNPRRTYPYGIKEIPIYAEVYGVEEAASEGLKTRVEVRGKTEGTSPLTQDLEFGSPSPAGVLRLPIPGQALPVGVYGLRLSIQNPQGHELASSTSRFLVTKSTLWLKENFQRVVSYLRYLASSRELKQLKATPPEERLDRWNEFWRVRDPLPITPINELLVEYFERIDYANRLYSAPLREGWLSDRWRVYILLGPPYEIVRDPLPSDRRPVEVWRYFVDEEVELVFQDQIGFQNYQLITPLPLERLLQRLRHRAGTP